MREQRILAKRGYCGSKGYYVSKGIIRKQRILDRKGYCGSKGYYVSKGIMRKAKDIG